VLAISDLRRLLRVEESCFTSRVAPVCSLVVTLGTGHRL